MGELIDQYVQYAADQFLALPSIITERNLAGDEYPTWAGVYDITHKIAQGLDDEHTMNLIKDMLDDDSAYKFDDLEAIFDQVMTPREVLRAMINHIIDERVRAVPGVTEREDVNVSTFDEFESTEDAGPES